MMKDCMNNEIHEGSILKVFHFKEKSGKKHFMYKIVGEEFITTSGDKYRKIYHLGETGYYLKPHNSTLEDSVVVQCNCEYHIHNDLKRSRFHGP